MTSTLDLSIVIVSYNVRERLRVCLDSVREVGGEGGLTAEILVVDNASADRSADMVEADFTDVAVVRNKENEGYGAACNRGAASSTGTVLLFLNADVELTEGSVRKLWDTVQGEGRVGLAGPMLVGPEGHRQNSVRRFPSPGIWLLDGTIFERWLPTRILLCGYKPRHRSGLTARVDWVEGACLAVRRDVFEEVGGFDERYFMYCEELDLSRRMRDAGWRRVYVPAAEVVHGGGASAKQFTARSRALFLRSKVRFADRTWGIGMARAAAAFYAVALGIELCLELGKLLLPLGDWNGRVRAVWTLWNSLGMFIRGVRPDA